MLSWSHLLSVIVCLSPEGCFGVGSVSKWKPNSQSPSTGLFYKMCGKLLKKEGFAWGSRGPCVLLEAELRPGLQEIEQE